MQISVIVPELRRDIYPAMPELQFRQDRIEKVQAIQGLNTRDRIPVHSPKPNRDRPLAVYLFNEEGKGALVDIFA